MNAFKQPISVLVVIHSLERQVLLLERIKQPLGWQSITGSRDGNESLVATAQREVLEETGLDVATRALRDWHLSNRYQIHPLTRNRYAPEITHNIEHVFSLCLPVYSTITLAPSEHRAYRWLPLHEAAEACFSWSNRDAILML